MLLCGALLACATVAPARAEDFRVIEGGHLSPESYPGMQLAWREEFDASRPGESWGPSDSSVNDSWRNENRSLVDGYLVIAARREGEGFTYSGLSGRDRQAFSTGRLDVRVRLPEGRGLRALARVETNDGKGAVDVVEWLGDEADTVHGTLHWRHENRIRFEGGSLTLPHDRFSGGFHVFSLVWDENQFQWLADGREYFRKSVGDPEFAALHQPFHIVLELSVGGDRAGPPGPDTEFPQRLIVDYVRYFQPAP
jgi:beta-glucanase (GH16 family)